MFDVVAAREAWNEMIPQCQADKLVFLDESGVNTDLSRRYGRAIGGARSVDKTPLNTPAARQKKLCKSRQATIKGTGANRGSARAGHRLS